MRFLYAALLISFLLVGFSKAPIEAKEKELITERIGEVKSQVEK